MSRTGAKKLSLRITQASLNQTAFDYPWNMANIYAAIDEAVKQGADRLELGELDLTGYEGNDDFARIQNKKVFRLLSHIAAYAAAKDPNLIVTIGHPWRLTKRDVKAPRGLEAERHNNRLFNRLDQPFNAHSTITGGLVRAMTAKLYLFRDERGYEDRHFAQWSMRDANEAGGRYGTIDTILPDGRTIPFGQPVVQYYDRARDVRQNEVKAICEGGWIGALYNAPYDDAAYDRDSIIANFARYIGSKKGLLALEPDSSPPASLKIDKHTHLALLPTAYAEAVLKTDNVGSSGSTFAQAGHRLAAQDGEIISYGQRFSFRRAGTTTTTIAMHSAPKSTARKAHVIIEHDFRNADAKPEARKSYETHPDIHGWDDPAYEGRVHEERIRMQALWFFDYMRKGRHQGFAEALSGGADSSHNCAVIYAMVSIGMRELDVDGFLRAMSHLSYANEIDAAYKKSGRIEDAVKACVKNMLTCVYMGTDNSSEETLNSARVLADGLGAKFITRNVQDLLNFNAFVYACEDTSKIEPARKGEILQAVAEYLNQKAPECATQEDADRHLAALDRQKEELARKYPELEKERLICVADPRDVVAYENIQARVRTVIIHLVANDEKKMAVANPNLDEMRNAYATYAGDLHGGTIAGNAHLNKADELEDMAYMHKHGLKGAMEPLLCLAPVLKLRPTAELQPKDASGKVVQNDEDALQRNFHQMRRLGRLMLNDRTRDGDEMRLRDAGEVYDACISDPAFAGVDENRLYNMVRLTYMKFYGPAQNKIHAGAIASTFGENVDHQSSRRTSNLNGGMRDELAELGLRLIFKWAQESGTVIPGLASQELEMDRPSEDEDFLRAFDSAVRNSHKGTGRQADYDLKNVFERVASEGWNGVFPKLAAGHALAVAHGAPKI